MGKRKERRLAAKSNAGRRVKLDLFAEPSGELGGSTVHDDVGEDMDSRHRDGLPNSPSSSGQQPKDSLLLLGQYSDDELDEESSEGLNHAKLESPLQDEEAKCLVDEECKDIDNEVNVDEDPVSQTGEQKGSEQNFVSLVEEGCDNKESYSPSVCGLSDVQGNGDVSLGWKMVMHEESNRYYYWNVETGETSWEVPQVLAQAAEFTSYQTTVSVDKESMENTAVDVNNPDIAPAVHGSLSANTIDSSLGTVISHGEVYGHQSQVDGWDQQYINRHLEGENRVTDVKGNEFRSFSDHLDAPSVGENRLRIGSKYDVEGNQSEIDFPSHLVKRSECLLERLKSLDWSKEHVQVQDLLSRYILEVEIRLSDFKSLAFHGSSLLPFWLHSEMQIKRLESLIDDGLDKGDARHDPSCSGNDGPLKSMKCESKADENGLCIEISHDSPYVDASALVVKGSCERNSVNTEYVSASESLPGYFGTGEEVSNEPNGTKLPEESTHKHKFDGEDVDMDVDMEVEEENSSGNINIADVSTVKDFALPDQPLQPNPPAEYSSLSQEMEFVVPPPPEDEWIPPPPPDNELVPPPPPDNELVPPPPLDDPPKASFPTPPSYTEPRQSLSYAEQYNLSYPGASFQYYGNTATEVPGSNIYRHAEGCQVAIPHSQLYYGAVPNAYTENVQVIANPVGVAAYYEFQDGSVPAAVSVISRVEPSGYQTESAPVTHDNLVSDQTSSFSSSAAAGSNSVPHVTDGISCVVGGDNKASLDVPSTSATLQAAATIFVEESVSAPSATPVVSATLSLVPKVQSKVSRSKKRTVSVASSLRSNKKVSSLVDKWKAAKEELLEDEEEPESAYEILERKRQREIEEWRAKQIASGEAKDNANFQPLGGDWRERVKRKRAQSAKKSVESSEVAVSEQNQQPDLVELSKNLPYGWQAYWDASSKQVYYGNVLTSVTTWTRPTK